MTATLCRVVNFVNANGVYRIRVIGSKRVALTNLRFDDGTWKAEGKVIPDLLGDQNEETVSDVLRVFRASFVDIDDVASRSSLNKNPVLICIFMSLLIESTDDEVGVREGLFLQIARIASVY